ncbi:hypothetical protein LINGRAHAP2_LOCUS35382, partial [Linum grandiflorum]
PRSSLVQSFSTPKVRRVAAREGHKWSDKIFRSFVKSHLRYQQRSMRRYYSATRNPIHQEGEVEASRSHSPCPVRPSQLTPSLVNQN